MLSSICHPLFWQNIVADMRKVLAKNPQVEQQRLHRRVFLETINPENQALMVRISFFSGLLTFTVLQLDEQHKVALNGSLLIS